MATRKIDAMLSAMERANQLTTDGKNWLVTACDPFHDRDVQLAGYPDLITASTVVQLIKKQIQVTVPTTGNGTVTAGQNWDCSIAWTPRVNTQVYADALTVDGGSNITASAGVNGCQFGGLVIAAGPQGQDMWPSQANGGVTNVTSTAVSIPEYGSGHLRVISAGFEVVNTTSQLNRQGQLTAYRTPSHPTPSTLFQASGTANAFNTYPAIENSLPPSNLAAATLLPGSRTWEAAEGAYVTARQNGLDNPMQQATSNQTIFPLADASAQTTQASTQLILGNITNTTTKVQNSLPDVVLPFDISGVHLSGLSYTTTLTVNCRWYVERMPTQNSSALVVLATPPARYDPVALELYARALADMPPGVRLSENPLGEWFSSALSKVADWAPKIGSALGTIIPGASAIGNVVGGASRIASNILRPTQPDSASPIAARTMAATQRKRKPKKKLLISATTKSRK